MIFSSFPEVNSCITFLSRIMPIITSTTIKRNYTIILLILTKENIRLKNVVMKVFTNAHRLKKLWGRNYFLFTETMDLAIVVTFE
mmetsp:Transcript_1818/g.2613  ORF Transcript_1818/g.2613 Transcript_1818/m.2613 type:complete len:85 (-) Transcript_1818:112-366(-)